MAAGPRRIGGEISHSGCGKLCGKSLSKDVGALNGGDLGTLAYTLISQKTFVFQVPSRVPANAGAMAWKRNKGEIGKPACGKSVCARMRPVVTKANERFAMVR